MLNPKARVILESAMEKFLFEGQEDAPQGYVPPKDGEWASLTARQLSPGKA